MVLKDACACILWEHLSPTRLALRTWPKTELLNLQITHFPYTQIVFGLHPGFKRNLF